jgi:hypothetical protein
MSNNNQIEFTIKTIYSCHCLDYRDTILALKAAGVSNSTMSGASRFQSHTVLGKNDIFLVSIREDGIWNDVNLTCTEAVQRRAARYVANNHRNRSSVSNIIQRLKWRPLADRWDFQVSTQKAKSFICFAGNIIYVLVPL